MKVKLRVHYGTHRPGDTADIKAEEAEYLISTRQAVAANDPESPEEDIPPADPEGEPIVPPAAEIPDPESLKKKGSVRKGAADGES